MTDFPQRNESPALATALRLLARRERTVGELRAELLKTHLPEETESALAWLVSRRMLSDERAAEATIRPRSVGRRAEGDQKLRERLEQRGASEEAIGSALADIPDEAQRMHEALAGKFSPQEDQRAKAGRFLLSRGFDEESIDGALDRFFGDG